MAKAPAKAPGKKAEAAKKPPRKPSYNPKTEKEEIKEARLALPPDPDTIVSGLCGDRLEEQLRARKINISKTECHMMAFAVLVEFLRGRAREWGFTRPISAMGKPRAEILGFAEASLGVVAETGMEMKLPFDLPIGDWEPEQVATFLAIGFDTITEQRARVMEYEGDDIPF